MNRCSWVNNNINYINYHDNEWGVVCHDDNKLFELLILELFQAGLSWECILNKRDSFRKAFDYFDPLKVSLYDSKKIDSLLNNKDIIRNRLKIISSINNAKAFLRIQREYKSFDNYIWSFTNNKVINHKLKIMPTSNELSDIITKDLKNKGMKFIGTTIIYSYLQAIGVFNDHELNCSFK